MNDKCMIFPTNVIAAIPCLVLIASFLAINVKFIFDRYNYNKRMLNNPVLKTVIEIMLIVELSRATENKCNASSQNDTVVG